MSLSGSCAVSAICQTSVFPQSYPVTFLRHYYIRCYSFYRMCPLFAGLLLHDALYKYIERDGGK